MIKVEHTLQALYNLGFIDNYVMNGNPQNENEFKVKFRLITGKDEIDSIILSDVYADWGVTWQEILDEIDNIKQEEELNAYKGLRASEYPSIQDQLDMQYWDSVNGTTTWADAIETIKTKYPKPV